MSNDKDTRDRVRAYQAKDRERVRMICVQTAPEALKQHEMMQPLLLRAFCDYYIEQEPENCFVVTNERDEAVGYIVCTEDASTWYRVFHDNYILPMGNEQARQFLETTCEACLSVSTDYPAHLHTDILPEYQRMGLGALMMETLITHLRDKDIHGLALSVASENEGAQRFYKKMGFQILEQRPHETVMGIFM